MAVTYRKARPGDTAALRTLLAELGYDALPDGPYAETFAQVVAHPEFDVWLATDGLPIVGLLVLSHRPALRLAGRVASIDELVVASSRRAEGIGSKLLAMAIERARSLKCIRLELDTRRSRESYTRGFYRKHGFAEVDSAVLRLELQGNR